MYASTKFRLSKEARIIQLSTHFFRFIDGVADAAAWNSIVSILMVIFPNKAAFIVATTETLFGIGLAIGLKTHY